MAIEKIGWVKSIEWKTAPRGGKYIAATVLQEGEEKTRVQNVFDQFVDVFVEAHEKELLLTWTIEKKDDAKYWNIIAASLAGDALKSPDRPAVPRTEGQTRSQEIEENMWWKILGECIIRKDVDTSTPHGKALRAAFYAKMFSVLNITIETE